MIYLKQYKDSDYSSIKNYCPKKEINKYTNRGGYRILSIFAIYRSNFYLLWEDDEVIGCGVIRWKWSREFHCFGWWLFAIWVHPNHRGTGKGVVLMTKLIEEVKRKKIKNVLLNVDISNNIAQNLYKKIGFEEVKLYSNQIYMQYDL